MRDVGDIDGADRLKWHCCVWERTAVRWVFHSDFIRPWRVRNDDAIGTAPRQWRRFSADRGSLPQDLEAPERSINPTGAIHVSLKLAEFFGLLCRRGDNGLRLLVCFTIAKPGFFGGKVAITPFVLKRRECYA